MLVIFQQVTYKVKYSDFKSNARNQISGSCFLAALTDPNPSMLVMSMKELEQVGFGEMIKKMCILRSSTSC
jgi:hypothetical protein